MSALGGVRVLELAERPAGEYCGKLLSNFGAEVIKVESPAGSPTRRMAPSVVPGNEGSGLFAYLNTNKKSVTLDLASKAGLDLLHKLISTVDVVIDDHDEDWLRKTRLAPAEAEHDHPMVIFCSLTPYGHGAPRDWWNAQSLNVFHRSGWGYHTPTHADPRRPPLKGPGRFLVDYEGALDAATCIVSSLYWRMQSKKGQYIDVSELEVQAFRNDTIVGRLIAGEAEADNLRTNFDQGGPHGFYSCADGAVYLYMTSKAHWAGFKALLGNPDWAAQLGENWLEFEATPENVGLCRTRFAAWVLQMKKEEVSADGQKLGVPLVPVNHAGDLHRSPQYIFRNYFQRLKHPAVGDGLYPTVPYKLSASPATITTAAPALGEHTAEILAAGVERQPKQAAAGE
jgi:crotonobetainyl-CoA:carnitine CoA-transferase CaiB-like acyl-CoA transferase